MSNTASRALPWVALSVAALCGRMLWESHVALQAGEEALRRGDVAEGVTRLRRALQCGPEPFVAAAPRAAQRFEARPGHEQPLNEPTPLGRSST